MRYIHFTVYFALLITTCFALNTDTRAHSDPGIFRRGSSTGSTSPPPSSSGAKSPPRKSVRLFGVDVTPGVKGAGPAAHHAQTQHAHPAHTTTQAHHTQAVRPTHAASPHPGQSSRGRSSALYNEWVQGLSGDLAKSRSGPRPKPPPAPVYPDPPGAKRLRAPPGTHPRYQDQKRYREKKKAQMQAQLKGKRPAEHHEHHQQGKGGGRGPGSPGAGAGTHAVMKRRLARSSVAPGL